MSDRDCDRSGRRVVAAALATLMLASASPSVLATDCLPLIPPDAIFENEPACGVPIDNYNGGCHSPTNAAVTVPVGATIVGTVVDDMVSVFDTDTYDFVLPWPGGNVTVQAWADFPVYAVIDDLNCESPLLAVGLSEGCEPATASLLALPPGTHRLLVTSFPSALPCGSRYVATIRSCPCPGDLDGDCTVSTSDLVIFLSRFGRTGQAPYSPGDLNNDRKVDTADLVLFLSRFGCDGR